MARIIEFEGRQIEMPDDVTDSEVAQILGGEAPPAAPSTAPTTGLQAIAQAANPMTGIREIPETFSSVREASRGGAPAAVEMIFGQPGSTQEKVLGSVGRLMGMPSREGLDVAAEKVDPYLANLAGAGAAGGNAVFGPLAKELALAERGLKGAASLGVNEAMGQPLSVPEMNDVEKYILEGTPTGLLPNATPVDTSNVAANVVTGLGTEMFNEPVVNAGMLALGPKYVKGMGKVADLPRRGLEATGIKTPRHIKAVDLLQEAVKPSSTSEIGVEFEGIGQNSLRLGTQKWSKATGRTKIDRGIDATKQANREQGAKYEEMYTAADQAGTTFDPISTAVRLENMAQHPYFQLVDPAMGVKIMEMAQEYRGKSTLSAREAGEALQFINKMQEAARNRVGASEARVESSPDYLQLEEIAKSIRSELNQKISRTPNEFLEVSRDYGDTAKLLDLLQKAKVQARNTGKGKAALLSPVGAEGLGGKMYNALLRYVLKGMERTPDRLVGKAFKLGAKAEFPEPSPIPPQKPTTLPPPAGGASPPPPAGQPPGGGGGGNLPVAPATPLPPSLSSPVPQPTGPQPPKDVVQNSLGSARSGRTAPDGSEMAMKLRMHTQAELLTETGLPKSEWGPYIEKYGERMGEIAEDLLHGKLTREQAVESMNEVIFPGSTGTFQPPPVSPAPTNLTGLGDTGKPFTPINLTPLGGEDVFLKSNNPLKPPGKNPPSDKQNFIRPPGPTRPPTPGSSATQMGGRSRHPDTRATVQRGTHDPVEVIFKDKADKIAFGGGKKSHTFKRGENVSNLEQIKNASEWFKKAKYPNVETRQISAAMREYNKFIVDLAKLQEKSGTDLRIDPLSFDEFAKTTYPSIFGQQ